MAKRKGQDSQPSAEVDKAAVLISEKQLNKLLKEGKSLADQIGELNGAMREKIGYAKDHNGLHTGAFSDVRRLFKMRDKPEKLAERYRTFLAYMEMSGLNEIINGVSRLPLSDDKGEAGDVGGQPAKVSSLQERRAARAAQAEQAETEEAELA